MKVSKLKGLGLRQKTLDEMEIPIADVISTDEFNTPRNSKDYRESAIDRLVDLKVGFTSNCNIVYNLMKRFVGVECPYCGGKMKSSTGSGNGMSSSMHYVCEKCESEVNLTTFNDGFHAGPSEKIVGRK